VEEAVRLPHTDLGMVLYPGLRANGPEVKAGDSIILVLPDGQQISTIIQSLPLINRRDYKGFAPVALPSDIQIEEIPTGTQVWQPK
jgi:hypothetical protein